MHPIPTHEPAAQPNPAYTRPSRVPTRSQLAPDHWPWQAGKRNETGQQGGQSLISTRWTFVFFTSIANIQIGLDSLLAVVSSFATFHHSSLKQSPDLPPRHAASLVPLLSIALLFFINKLYIYLAARLFYAYPYSVSPA